jgi:hypothetical protein
MPRLISLACNLLFPVSRDGLRGTVPLDVNDSWGKLRERSPPLLIVIDARGNQIAKEQTFAGN